MDKAQYSRSVSQSASYAKRTEVSQRENNEYKKGEAKMRCGRQTGNDTPS